MNAYEWRFGTDGPSGFLLSLGVPIINWSEGPPYGSLAEVVRHGRLQTCDGSRQQHTLICRNLRLDSRILVAEDRVVIILRDTATVNAIRSARPDTVWFATFLPGQRYTNARIPLEYR